MIHSPSNPEIYRQRPVLYCVVLFFFAGLLGWVYSPVITQQYGFNDDFHLLKRVADHSFRVSHSEYSDGGRPLLGLGTKWLFKIPHSVNTLNHARIVSVVGIWIFAISAFAILRNNRFGVMFSITVALVMALTPGFAVYAGWLTEGLNSYAAAAALAAGNFIGLAVEGPGRSRRAFYSSLGAALLLASLLTYQPVAAFAAVALLLRAWRDFEIDWPRTRLFLLGLAVYIAVTAIYFLGYKIICLVFDLGGQAQRAGLTKHPLDNLHFVGTEVLWSGVTSWSRFHDPVKQVLTALMVGAVLLFGCVAKPWKKISAPVLGVSCALLTLLISVLPLLMLEEHFSTFRTQTVLHAALALLFVIGLERGIRGMLPLAMGKWVRPAAFAGLIGLTASLTHFHLERDFVAPNVREAAILTEGIAKLDAFPEKLAYIVPAQWDESAPVNLAEFRAPSSPFSWVTAPMLELLMIQHFEKDTPLRAALRRHSGFIVEYGPGTNRSLPVLDGFTLLDGTSTMVQDPYWGAIRTNETGWCVSGWFGVFNNRRFPLICHSELGWLTCSGKGLDDISFYSEQFGSFSTSPKSYPSLHFDEGDTCFFLSQTITWPTCAFQNCRTKEWTFSPNSPLKK